MTIEIPTTLWALSFGGRALAWLYMAASYLQPQAVGSGLL